jgi:hypothetical protein
MLKQKKAEEIEHSHLGSSRDESYINISQRYKDSPEYQE